MAPHPKFFCRDGSALLSFVFISNTLISGVNCFVLLHYQYRENPMSRIKSCTHKHFTRYSFESTVLDCSAETDTTNSCTNESQSKASSSSTSTSLDNLYHNLGAFSLDNLSSSSKDVEPLLCLSTGTASSPYENSERGVILTRDVKRDSILLSIPISSCLCDDSPPDWFYAEKSDDITDSKGDKNNGNVENIIDDNKINSDDDRIMKQLLTDHTNHHLHNPSQWATRLAASLLELQHFTINSKKMDKRQEGLAQWLSMGPNPSSLRASLPVHWSDDALSKARCCALELAVDSAYFARAEAVDNLLDGLRRKSRKKVNAENTLEDEEGIMAAQCHAALDFVQTRVCRVDRLNGLHPPMRILAPIFDFINHGSATGSRKANASFQLEQNPMTIITEKKNDHDSTDDEESDAYLVVRATRDMQKDEEVLINYGESTRPAWRCLASYGFIPDDTDGDIEDDCEDVAEVFMDGIRYEVGRSTVPMDMVVAAAAAIAAENGEFNIEEENDLHEESENPLTATVALRIAKRVSDVAFDLLLENTKSIARPEQGEVYDEDDEDSETAAEIHASSLAASLRYSQHRVLMSCAMGLKDYAGQNMGF